MFRQSTDDIRMNTTKLNLCVDALIGVAFVLTLTSGLTTQPVHGKMEFHILIGSIMMIGVAVHLILHRKWIAAAIRPGKKPAALTVNIWLNVLLGASGALTFVSGLGGHRVPGNDPFHAAAAVSMTIILLVHLARHRKWIVTAARRYGTRQRIERLTGE
jgi:hypothetical protein